MTPTFSSLLMAFFFRRLNCRRWVGNNLLFA